MKKFLVFCLTLPLFLANISSVCAQGDIVTVKASNFNGNTCAFNVTVSNHNSAGKNIDEIKLDITSLTPSVSFYDFTIPLHWNSTISGNQLEADGISDNGGIAPNGTVGGFIFSYSGGNDQLDNPVTISWTTRSSGADVSTGTMQTICTQFQQYLTLDTCTVIPSQSGADPCFTFTMINRNNQGLNSNATIWNV